ncbi:MAG: ABC transporter ATP-binding protein [Kiritimatiellia bacterium]
METAINVCPWCQRPIGLDNQCVNPHCGKLLDKGDWALVAAYGTDGLLPPETPDGPWRISDRVAENPTCGQFESQLPLELREEDGVHHIGSDISCHVRIGGIPARCCAVSLHYHRPTRKWWAFNWGSLPGAVTLNGGVFRNCALADNDIVAVAGASLRFRAGVLHAEYGSGTGVVLTVHGLVDGRYSRSESPRPLLDRVSFSVKAGEFVGILGPSGCGKSTLIKTIAGLSTPAEGKVCFNGLTRAEASAEIRALTGYLPQDVDASLHDDLTLAEEIRSYLAIHKLAEREDAVRVEELLAEFGLEEKKTARIATLSGGQRRRAALLLARLRNPSILLLDEPAAGLDRATETVLMNDLRRLAVSGANKTILCATHELANLHLFHRILVMSEGGLAYDGSPEDVFRAMGIADAAAGDRARLLYEALADPSNHEAVAKALHKNQSRVLPQPTQNALPDSSKAASWFGVLLGYLGRFRDSFLCDSFLTFGQCEQASAANRTFLAKVRCAWRYFKSWCFNSPMVLFVWQPLVVAFCIAVALKSKFSAAGDERLIVFFCAAIAAFWLGMGGSVRNLVATRKKRSLERLEGVGRSAYLAAVSLAALAKGAVQGIVLAVFLALFPRWFGCQLPLGMTPASFCVLGVCLVAVVWMGGFAGLAISALSASESFAVAMVPNMAVLALFFSQPLMEFDGGDTSCGARFARTLPAHYAHLTMFHLESSDTANKQTGKEEAKALGETTLAWITFCLLLSFAAQSIHEKNWEG